MYIHSSSLLCQIVFFSLFNFNDILFRHVWNTISKKNFAVFLYDIFRLKNINITVLTFSCFLFPLNFLFHFTFSNFCFCFSLKTHRWKLNELLTFQWNCWLSFNFFPLLLVIIQNYFFWTSRLVDSKFGIF